MTNYGAPVIGSQVQVIFKPCRNGSTVVGDADRFDKIALVGRRYHGEMPQPAEEWLCRVVHDTCPDNRCRGGAIVEPIVRLKPRVEWDLACGPQGCVLAVKAIKIGYRKLSRSANVVRTTGDIQPSWPAEVRQQCEQALSAGNHRYFVKTWDNDGKPSNPVVQVSFNHLLRHRVVTFAIRQLTDIKPEWPDSVRQDATRYLNEHLDRVALQSLEGGRQRRGQTEYPFQWVLLTSGRVLTNGQLHIPPVRPQGPQWRNYPFSAVPSECWDLFLQGLQGKFLKEVIPFREQVIAQQKQRRQPSLTARQREVEAAVTRGIMWTGGDGCNRVAIGRNMIFVVNRGERAPIHVVDNPGVGAIYLFEEYEEASRLASGKLRRSVAHQQGCRRIIHSRHWKEKLAAAIA